MATENTRYISYPEAVAIHCLAMGRFGEIRYGVAEQSLIESALARPRQAAIYENADLIRQAATLCYGLIKNHPWYGGNKRTATLIMREFLRLNGVRFIDRTPETVAMVLAVESDQWKVDEIEAWLREHTADLKSIDEN